MTRSESKNSKMQGCDDFQPFFGLIGRGDRGAERWLAMGLVAHRGHARKKQRPKTGRRKAGECLASFRHLLLYFGAALRLTAPCIRGSLTIDASTGPRSCQVCGLLFHLDVLGKPGSPAASACQAPAGRHRRWRSSGESSRRRRRSAERRPPSVGRRCTKAESFPRSERRT